MSVPNAIRHDTPSGKRAIYYYPNWVCYQRDYQVKDLPLDKITDLAYAFFDIEASGNVLSRDEWADFQNPLVGKGVEPQNKWDPPSPPHHLGLLGQLMKVKEAGKKLNVVLSVGGWTWSRYFSDAYSTPATRQKIVDSLKKFVLQYPGLFSGFSWDHEYLSDNGVNYGKEGNVARKEDAQNFIELLKLVRAAFPGYTNALCVSAVPEKVHIPLKAVSGHLTELHAMCYDAFDGSWGNTTTLPHTNPRKSSHSDFSCEGTADWLIGQGVPSTKIYIGAALYSRGFSNTDGLNKPASGGSPDFLFEQEVGTVPYHMLPRPGAVEFLDPETKSAYSYDPKRRVCNTYDNPISIAEKCKIVWEKNLAGIIFWEASGDVRDYNSPRSIMRTVAENLTHCKPPAPAPAPAPTVKPGPKPAPAPAVKPTPLKRL
jgi:chitinase